ncbi:hypothetical protein D7Y40_02480 [Stenotrophomonas maltophilia]|uniref:hypothetical protein n=1 Tax=Stenotrophomonas maltophilia TaxID=40324 RepID=UPI0015DE24A6|nr:hypothetical protein [Stenotrophomonas maltophilia]MBA0335267.1 hypothetical protein [Stenotrophomonas maltophilia]MBA0539362.1 hypothetical protein [Stenotrophomonas maltophilia]HDS1522618.1 hypothetical protein [Stenotrophomonas maltophilia]HDS1657416.1 hypothetical protein [Stenotrophomonas maltophilia]HDS1671439.1 hypothetical protein [Stenotrophomonas maltophilia]
MTPEELIRKRKRDELLKRANAAQTTAPSVEEKLVSDNTKETLKAAGHWAGVIGKRAAELTQKGAAVAAEKARDVKATVDARLAKAAEERVEATKEDWSSTPTVQQAEVEVATKFLNSEGPGYLVADGMGYLVADGMAQDLVLVDGEVWEGKAPSAEMAAEDVVEALPVHEPAAIAGEAVAFEVGEATLVAAPIEQQPVVEAPDLAPEVGALSDLPADAVEEPQVTNDVSIGQSGLAPGAVEELGCSPDATAPEGPQTSLQSRFRTCWPWVLGGVVAVALVAGALHFLQEKNEQPPPSASAPVAPVAAPVVPEQVPEVVEAPVVAPAPVVLPEQGRPEPPIEKPEPVAAPVVEAPTPIATQSMASPKRASPPLPKKAPAPVAEQKNDWQQKASDDLDVWAEKSGIK